MTARIPRGLLAVLKRDRWVLVGAALVYALQSLAWPLALGRDGGSFLEHYYDLFETTPFLPMITTYRTPVPSLWFGAGLRYLGPSVVECMQGGLFVAATWMFADTARRWGASAFAVCVIFAVSSTRYGGLYHQVSSDGLFAFAFLSWLYFAIRTADRHDSVTWACHGALIFLMVMVRPAAQLFALFAVVPLCLADRDLGRRLRQSIAIAGTLGVLLVAWSTTNYVRYDYFGVSRPTYAAQPFLRVFIGDRIVRADTGPASRALAEAVERELLSQEPYRSHNISLTQFLSTGTMRTWSDVVALSDRHWGWNSRYRVLLDVSLESIRANPGTYVSGVLSTFLHALFVATPTAEAPARGRHAKPPPPVADLIPNSYAEWTLSTPDGRYDPQARDRAGALEKLRQFEAGVEVLTRQLPARNGNAVLSHWLNRIGLVWVPMIVVFLAGLVGIPFLCVTPEPHERLLCAIWGLAVLYLVATFSGQVPPIVHYRVPLDPALVLTSVVALRGIWRGRSALRTLNHTSAAA